MQPPAGLVVSLSAVAELLLLLTPAAVDAIVVAVVAAVVVAVVVGHCF